MSVFRHQEGINSCISSYVNASHEFWLFDGLQIIITWYLARKWPNTMKAMRQISEKIKRKLRWTGWDILDTLGFSISLNQQPGSVRVLCFHGICADDQDYINGRFIKISHFKRLMDAIQQHYHVISLDDFIQKRFNLERLNILLTFDDGYYNLHSYLVPIINENQIPVTLFVTSRKVLCMDLLDIWLHSDVSKKDLFDKFPEVRSYRSVKYWAKELNLQQTELLCNCLTNFLGDYLRKYEVFHRLLSYNDLEELSQNPFLSIANHSANHLNIPNLSNEEIIQEVEECNGYLSGLKNSYQDIFAYPYGNYSKESIDLLNLLGIQYQFTLDQSNTEKTIGRLTVNPFISITNQLLAIEQGSY